MEEQLKLILCLRAEVRELMQLKENDENEYNNIIRKFDSTFEELKDIDKKLDEMTLFFRNAKDMKVIKFNGFLSIFVMIITLILLIVLTNIPLANILLIETITLIFTLAIPVMLASTVFNNIIEKYLVKKYPNIKMLYNNVKSLSNRKRLKEQRLMKLRSDRETINASFKYREQQLSIKKDELFKLEENYFNNLNNSNISDINVESNSHVKNLVRKL